MVLNFLTKVFGSKNERELKRFEPIVEQINALELGIQALSDEHLQARTAEFKQRIDQGEA
ncbi:MAG: hypothetical protein JRC59_02845, partial [Deltaproteobacteria bacterium]|nr:hypothetical protein [Deltaproteobacteria bacterium]